MREILQAGIFDYGIIHEENLQNRYKNSTRSKGMVIIMAEKRRKILVAEDETAINRMICMNLGITGYDTEPFSDGNAVLSFLETGGYADLALVDIMLPGTDGFSLLEPLRAHGIPVIYLTALGDIESKVRGLRGGAEDYMVKPFEMPELLVRMEKVLERTGKSDTEIILDGITVDLGRREVRRGAEIIPMTPMEFDLLTVLAKSKNLAIRREKLLSEVWGFDFEGETRTVDVHIAQLRKKTGLNFVSVPKIGYRLEVENQ